MRILALLAALSTSAAAFAQMATMPADANAPTATQAAQQQYPRCSSTVQDQCLQSSARESDTKGGPPAGIRKMQRPGMMRHHHRMMKNHPMKS